MKVDHELQIISSSLGWDMMNEMSYTLVQGDITDWQLEYQPIDAMTMRVRLSNYVNDTDLTNDQREIMDALVSNEADSYIDADMEPESDVFASEYSVLVRMKRRKRNAA